MKIKFFTANEIINFFSLLNENGIEYILLRNFNNELPSNLPITKDVDLIVEKSYLDAFESLLLENKWERIPHPFRNIPFLYGMDKFRFYNKLGLHIDVCCQLSCRSLNNGEWFPLHMKIQDEVWNNRIETSDKPWKYQLAYEDEFLHLITRCVFDKKNFSNEYIERIKYLSCMVNHAHVKTKLELVFYKFTEVLLKLIETGRYEKIIQSYLQFEEY